MTDKFLSICNSLFNGVSDEDAEAICTAFIDCPGRAGYDELITRLTTIRKKYSMDPLEDLKKEIIIITGV